MLSNINIKISGLSEKISLELVHSLNIVLNSYSFLDFRRFENIIITSNFQKDIEDLTSNKKASFKNRYRTNNNNVFDDFFSFLKKLKPCNMKHL